MTGIDAIDVHQHLWPAALVDALRARADGPRLDGWTLRLPGEPDYQVDPAHHDVARRAELAAADGITLALISLSSPLGIEHLPPDHAAPLLDAYHAGVLALPAPFGAWAAACVSKPEPSVLADLLSAGCAGLQLPATALADEAGYEAASPLLEVLADAGKPLFIHPGPASTPGTPAWWPAMVPYVSQMHAAWYAFAAFGRPAHPVLRVCFAMLAGLAPLHHERAAARGGPVGSDPLRFVDTSSYGPDAVTPIQRLLGPRAVVLGSDRPYAPPLADADEAVAVHAPRSLLGVPAGGAAAPR